MNIVNIKDELVKHLEATSFKLLTFK